MTNENDVERLKAELIEHAVEKGSYSKNSVVADVVDYLHAQGLLTASGRLAGWMPIDSAPKDGTIILAIVGDWYTNKVRYELLQYSINAYWESAYHGNQTFENCDVKCWQPIIPPAPSARKEG